MSPVLPGEGGGGPKTRSSSSTTAMLMSEFRNWHCACTRTTRMRAPFGGGGWRRSAPPGQASHAAPPPPQSALRERLVQARAGIVPRGNTRLRRWRRLGRWRGRVDRLARVRRVGRGSWAEDDRAAGGGARIRGVKSRKRCGRHGGLHRVLVDRLEGIVPRAEFDRRPARSCPAGRDGGCRLCGVGRMRGRGRCGVRKWWRCGVLNIRHRRRRRGSGKDLRWWRLV